MKNITVKGQALFIYIVFAIIFAGCIWAAVHALKPVNANDYETVTIKSGDTLWNIATRYKENGNVTAFIDWVEDVNHVNAKDIKAGEKLVIPVKKHKENDLDRTELASR